MINLIASVFSAIVAYRSLEQNCWVGAIVCLLVSVLNLALILLYCV